MFKRKVRKSIYQVLLFALLVTLVACKKTEVTDSSSSDTTGTTEVTTHSSDYDPTVNDTPLNVQLKDNKTRVSIHDPSIVKDGDTYYIFGSHIDAAKSTDLINWSRFTNGYTTPNNRLYGNLSENLSGSFDWAGENDSDSLGGFSIWAPDVFFNKDYVNQDGSTGAYMIYYSASSTYIRSAIGIAVSQTIEGPYSYSDTIIYSGMTKHDAYDNNSLVNKKYTNTNIQTLIDEGVLTGPRDSWFRSNGDFNNSHFPNAIDATLFYDEDGKLWMTYGSWSGGIFLLELDKSTGKPIYPGSDGTTEDGRLIDRYYGIKIAGGYGKSGEGPYIMYDATSGYYFLFVTYGWLGVDGGYNMRLFRATSPDGPYLDAAGRNAVLPSQSSDNVNYGIKLMGNYDFSSINVGYKSPGHNSAFIDQDGQMFLIYHTRFNNGSEGHEVRVHQMFTNADGWLTVAPYEYDGEQISETGYSKEEIVGNYEFINHGTTNSTGMLATRQITLNDDFTISGDVSGTWGMTNGSYYMNMVISGVTYKGVFFKQHDESKYETKVMTFSAIGTNNQSIWGSRELDDEQAAQIDAYSLRLPISVRNDIELPTSGINGTTISWTSTNPSVVDNTGKIYRQAEDVEVYLIAQVTKGNETVQKSLRVKVRAE